MGRLSKSSLPPDGISLNIAWWAAKIGRRSNRVILDFKDTKETPFWFGVHGWMLQGLHAIDMDLGGSIGALSTEPGTPERDRYIIRSLMEEAIASSQIEGAAVTRDDAKEMLKTGRKPQTLDEKMVLNNYRAITWLREHKNEPLSKDILLEIHRLITDGTLDDPSASGRFRTRTERVSVVDDRDNEVLHVPPPADQLEERFSILCAFANADESSQPFLHPVLRAIILHFMLAYDHPFVDGNGRAARALFYWHMLRSRYWLFELLSISRIVRKAPAQYVRAFLNAETDEADLTYFIKFHLHVIDRARKELHDYLEAQRSANEELARWLRAHKDMNHRQRAPLGHAIRHPRAIYSFESHRGSHNVTYQTARTDLIDLANRGLLIEYKSGRRREFAVPPELPRRLRAAPKKSAGRGK